MNVRAAPSETIERVFSEAVHRARAVDEIEDIAILLAEIGRKIEMPIPVWLLDVGEPCFDEASRFWHAAGVSGEIAKVMLDRGFGAQSEPIVRCRLEVLPFVYSSHDIGSVRSRLNREEKAVNKVFGDVGVRSSIYAPLHLPQGRIGAMSWAGALPTPCAEQIVSIASAEIMQLGYTLAARLLRNDADTVEPEDMTQLSARERECLRLVASGFHVPEVATKTGTAESTVRYHLANARDKLGASSQAHAVVLASQLGMLGRIPR